MPAEDPFPTPTQKPPQPPHLPNILEEGQWWVCLCSYRLSSPDCVRPALCPGKLTSQAAPASGFQRGHRMEAGAGEGRLGHLCPALPAAAWHSWRKPCPCRSTAPAWRCSCGGSLITGLSELHFRPSQCRGHGWVSAPPAGLHLSRTPLTKLSTGPIPVGGRALQDADGAT